MLEVTNPADGTKLHSVATGSGTSAVANITPLTELVTSRLLGQDPLAYYSALSAGNLSAKITPSGISAAQADVVLAFTGTIDTTGISNFISTHMVAATLASPASGDAQDKILDLIRLKLNSTQLSQIATLLANGTDASAIKTSVVSTVAATNTYSIGGVVSGLTGSNSVTLLNGADNTVVASGNGVFKFSTSVVYNGNYAVTVGSQPTGQTCTVGSGSGSGVVANVSNVTVTCSNITYTVSGTVSGLTSGNSVTILNNAGNATTVSANVAFAFSTPVAYSGSYAVTVGTQPIGQTCTVSRGSGSGVVANVSDLAVTCSNITYTVGGSVSGLGAGNQVTLQNNASNATTVSANGGFTFSIPVAYKGSYLVTVGTQPSGQTCTVSNGSGSGVVANIGNLTVTCSNTNTNNTQEIVGLIKVMVYANERSVGQVFNTEVIDLNGDGLEDVIIAGWSLDSTVSSRNSYIPVKILIQQMDGTLLDKSSEWFNGNDNLIYGAQRILVEDFDGDGKLDIFLGGFQDVPSHSAPSVIFWNEGGRFTRQSFDEMVWAHNVCSGDLYGTGRKDIIMGRNEVRPYTIYKNNGGRKFILDTSIANLTIDSAGACSVIKDKSTSNTAIISTNMSGGLSQSGVLYSGVVTVFDSKMNYIEKKYLPGSEEINEWNAVHDLVNIIKFDLNGDGRLDLIITDNGNFRLNKPVGKFLALVDQGNFAFSDKSREYFPTQTNDYIFGYYSKIISNGTIDSLFISNPTLQTTPALWKFEGQKFSPYLWDAISKATSADKAFVAIYKTKSGALNLLMQKMEVLGKFDFYTKRID
jgi:hypothetical protein